MLARVIDHLWQSIGFFAIAGLLATMLRPNSAAIRTWVWRIAAIKFVAPFAWLHAFGTWYGFPVRHNAIPPPAVLTDAAATWLPLATPAQSFAAPTFMLAIALIAGLIVSATCLLRIRRKLQTARYERLAEEARAAVNWEVRPPAPGSLKAASLTAAAALALSIPIIAGGLEDRQLRQAALAIDTRSLSSANITMRESASGFGPTRVDASGNHVEIRRINIKDLVALVYGIDQFEVFGGAMPWMSTPYYDVSVKGPINVPRVFDPYSLREPVTKFLHDQYGVSIRVNGACQEPCEDYASIVVERVKWCSNLLGPRSTCPQ